MLAFVRSASSADTEVSVDPEMLRTLRSHAIGDRLLIAVQLAQGMNVHAEGMNVQPGDVPARGSGIDLTPLFSSGLLSHDNLRIALDAGHIGLHEAELLLRYIRNYSSAVETFGKTNGLRWLGAANRALGGATPASLLATEDGGRAVETLLGRIDHGIAS